MIKNFVKKWLKAIRYYLGLGVYSDKYPSLSMKPVVIAKKRYWKFTDDTMMPTMRALAYIMKPLQGEICSHRFLLLLNDK